MRFELLLYDFHLLSVAMRLCGIPLDFIIESQQRLLGATSLVDHAEDV
jgi:hypothetical protein